MIFSKIFAPMLVIVIAMSILVGGCGGSKKGEVSSSKSKAADGTTEKVAGAKSSDTAELTIRLSGVGDKEQIGVPVPTNIMCTKSIPAQCNGVVKCPTATDDPFPTSEEICAWLSDEGVKLLTYVPAKEEACNMIFGGPAKATIKGMVGTTKIDASFSREHGCAIQRWDAIQALWTGELPPKAPDAKPNAGKAPDTPVSSDSRS